MKLDGKNPAAVLFKWNGDHDVYMLPNMEAFEQCDFMAAKKLANKSPYIFSTSKAGTYYFSCTYNGHCENGQKLMLQVTAAPTKNIVQLAVGSADLSVVVTALKAGGLVTALQGKGPFTVFAPSNAAFAKLPQSKATLASLLDPKNKDELIEILKYHVVDKAVYSKDLKSTQSVKTLQGLEVLVESSAAGVVINENSKVIAADIAATNGVVHVIDKVLFPG